MLYLPLRAARRDTSVPLSRTRTPFSVVQDRLCSVHAAHGFSDSRPRLCAVKVKLTMRLAGRARLLQSERFRASQVFFRFRRGALHRQRQTSLIVAGTGRDVIRPISGAQDQQAREGFLRALPFSFYRRDPPVKVQDGSGRK